MPVTAIYHVLLGLPESRRKQRQLRYDTTYEPYIITIVIIITVVVIVIIMTCDNVPIQNESTNPAPLVSTCTKVTGLLLPVFVHCMHNIYVFE